jgi:RecA/RadA recombinase
MSKTTEEFEKGRSKKQTKYITTGSTIRDLVIGGNTGCMGYKVGSIVNLVGDSSVGKSALAVQTVVANMFALGDKFVYSYDDAENGMSFDIEAMFGTDVPLITEDSPHSKTVEDLYVNIRKFEKNIKKGQIGLYILDSLDGLTSKKQKERGDERFKKGEAGKEFTEDTYGLDKQKFLSQEFFPDIATRIDDSNIILLIISQVRDNIKAGLYGKKHIRAGGRALQFYSHTVEWLAEVQKSEMVGEKTGLKAGGVVLCETTKSKTPRPYRSGMIVYDYSIGVDDIASCVDYLYDLRKNKDGSVSKTYTLIPTKRNKLDWDGELYQRDVLCDYIYDNELEHTLQTRVIDKWEKEQATTINRRKPRF